MLRSGHLNSTIRLERGTRVAHESGKRVTSWNVLAICRAQVVRQPIEELPKDTGKVVRRMVSFRTWFREDVQLEDRVVCGGFAYIVRGLTELGRRAGLDIQTEFDGAV